MVEKSVENETAQYLIERVLFVSNVLLASSSSIFVSLTIASKIKCEYFVAYKLHQSYFLAAHTFFSLLSLLTRNSVITFRIGR